MYWQMSQLQYLQTALAWPGHGWVDLGSVHYLREGVCGKNEGGLVTFVLLGMGGYVTFSSKKGI